MLYIGKGPQTTTFVWGHVYLGASPKKKNIYIYIHRERERGRKKSDRKRVVGGELRGDLNESRE